jgi:hypothetical protein
MTKAQLKHINYLLLTGQFGSAYDYLYALGGYIYSSDTNFMITNRRRYPIWVKNIRATNISCGAPLSGTLISASDGTSDGPRMQLGIILNSSSRKAMLALGPDPSHWKARYFSHPVIVNPGATRVFNVRATALDEACTFWLKAAITDDGQPAAPKLTSQPFRISAFPQAYIRAQRKSGYHGAPPYQAVFASGSASPTRRGELVQVYPKR